jgi:hypothetical protein
MLATKSIRNHVGFDGMIMDFKIIILYQFQPSSLPQSEYIFKTLVISEDIAVISHQIMPPNLRHEQPLLAQDHG